jgi:hypothetical protein
MELLANVGHVESCFGPFGDNVSAGQYRCKVGARFAPNVP